MEGKLAKFIAAKIKKAKNGKVLHKSRLKLTKDCNAVAKSKKARLKLKLAIDWLEAKSSIRLAK